MKTKWALFLHKSVQMYIFFQKNVFAYLVFLLITILINNRFLFELYKRNPFLEPEEG